MDVSNGAVNAAGSLSYGLTGKLSLVGVAVLAVVAVAIHRAHDQWFILLLVLVAIACAWYLCDRITVAAKQDPENSLQGPELLAWRQYKDLERSKVRTKTLEPNPGELLEASESEEEGDSGTSGADEIEGR